jgi:hypothetical protein
MLSISTLASRVTKRYFPSITGYEVDDMDLSSIEPTTIFDAALDFSADLVTMTACVLGFGAFVAFSLFMASLNSLVSDQFFLQIEKFPVDYALISGLTWSSVLGRICLIGWDVGLIICIYFHVKKWIFVRKIAANN